MENEKLEHMKQEVIETHNKIIKACECNNKLKKIYKGCLIYGSPLYKNPNIMFFGINPGGGYDYYKNGYYEPQNFNSKGYGVFWEELKKCLETINKETLLENIVITNRYFFATNNKKELDEFFDLLPHEFRCEVLSKQQEWTKILIEEISPKFIIAGGYSIKDRFDKLYPNPEIVEEGKHTKVLKINNILLIAYERKFNKMVDRKEFIKYLEKYTNEL